VYQDFELVTTSPGGHSSRPGPDNAIYVMATALERVGRFTFPLQLSDVTRAYFAKTAARVGGDARAAMLALLKEPGDARANALLSADRQWNSTLRTTCVATMIQGGHAMNALPQHVAANVNCRIFPGNKIETVRDTLVAAIADPQVAVSIKDPRSPATPAPPLSLRVMQPIEAVAAELFPGLPVMPVMTTGATDGIYVTAAGIPTYGFSGMFIDPDFGHIHGLNERIRVQSLLDGRKFQYRLIKRYAEQP
jgi:acetylornithine deacetylase/succinyl-diaminopimelate desuccinylase-like protein